MKPGDFDGLRKKLDENRNWPLRYMFKFIVPNKDGKVDLIKDILPSNGQLSFKHTKNLTYISITCIADMASVDDIIYISQQAGKVEGVISL